MTPTDLINVARCNKQRMMQDKTYTLQNTSQHDRWLEVYSTTRHALKLAVLVSKH
jgi:hypothetical protein